MLFPQVNAARIALPYDADRFKHSTTITRLHKIQLCLVDEKLRSISPANAPETAIGGMRTVLTLAPYVSVREEYHFKTGDKTPLLLLRSDFEVRNPTHDHESNSPFPTHCSRTHSPH